MGVWWLIFWVRVYHRGACRLDKIDAVFILVLDRGAILMNESPPSRLALSLLLNSNQTIGYPCTNSSPLFHAVRRFAVRRFRSVILTDLLVPARLIQDKCGLLLFQAGCIILLGLWMNPRLQLMHRVLRWDVTLIHLKPMKGKLSAIFQGELPPLGALPRLPEHRLQVPIKSEEVATKQQLLVELNRLQLGMTGMLIYQVVESLETLWVLLRLLHL